MMHTTRLLSYRRRRAGALLCVLVLAAGGRAAPGRATTTPANGLTPELSATVARGLNHLHNLDFTQAEDCFTQVATGAEQHPIGDVYLALTALCRGVTDGMSSATTARFSHHVEQATQRGFVYLGREHDPWQRFYLGAAFLFRACDVGRRGDLIEALQWFKRGVVEIDALRDDPQAGADACALLGACEFFSAYAPWYVRMVSSLLIIPADARQGMAHMEHAAAAARYVKTEATLLLATAYMWEREIDRALELSTALQLRYPGNHLLRTLQQEVLLRDSRLGEAYAVATNQVARISNDPRPEVHGLLADQHYTLGRIETERGNYQRALTHFAYAERTARAKPHLKAWALLRQGTVYDLLGRGTDARACYRGVAQLRPASPLVCEYAEQFIRTPYRGAVLE